MIICCQDEYVKQMEIQQPQTTVPEPAQLVVACSGPRPPHWPVKHGVLLSALVTLS